jgi:hypothetical protein
VPTISKQKLDGWSTLFQLRERTDVRMPKIKPGHSALQEGQHSFIQDSVSITRVIYEKFWSSASLDNETTAFWEARNDKKNSVKDIANIKIALQEHNSGRRNSPVLTSPILAAVLGSSKQTLPSLPAVQTSSAPRSVVLLIAFKQVTSVLTRRIEFMGAPLKVSGSSSRRLSSEEIAASPTARGTIS